MELAPEYQPEGWARLRPLASRGLYSESESWYQGWARLQGLCARGPGG